MKEKFVIIGSNSFSGSSFINYILKTNPEAKVVGLSRSQEYKECFLPYNKLGSNNFHFYQYNLNYQLNDIMTLIIEFKPDYIVNFAAQGMVGQSWNEPDQWFRTNCLGIMNLANCLSNEPRVKTFIKRYVQISTPEVYGTVSGKVSENQPLNPSTPYAASKAAGDLSLIPFFINKELPVVFTRATNVYGPYQQLYRIIPRTIFFIKIGKKIPLQGGGKAVKSYIHIRDVCDATLRISRDGCNGEIYHISPDGEGISIYNLIERICNKLGKNFEDCVDIVEDRLGQDPSYVIDSTKVREELDWLPVMSLDAGIDEVINWVDEYSDQLMNSPQDYIHKE